MPGDTFVFSGRLLRFEGVKELVAQCSLATTGDPKVPAYGGGRLPLSTFLADRVRGILQDPSKHPKLPAEVRQWLDIQKWRSGLPRRTCCWSRVSRAAAGSSSSPTASRAVTRTRRSACC